MKESTAAWAAYAAEQEEADPVVPLLVVQVADKPTEADLARVLDAIFDEWPDLPLEAVANVFGTHTDLLVGQQPVLDPGESFDYASHCLLKTDWGTMKGTYRMQPEGGKAFEVAIGRFYLVARTAEPSRAGGEAS